MKTKIIQFLVSRAGSLLTPVIMSIVVAAIAAIGGWLPPLAAMMDPVAITGYIVAALIAVINYYTNAVQGDGVERIQEAEGTLKVDRYAGPKTVNRVTDTIKIRRAFPVQRGGAPNR